MNRRLASILLASLVGIVAAPASGSETPPKRPSIVVIMLDDLGFSDLGCFGGEVHTPNIDRLAAGGVRFTRFYNASRCCPTRAALLTGLYPHQVGLARNGRDLSRDVPTVAELLLSAGYRTAMAGKWHLSETEPIGGRGDSPEQLAWLAHRGAPDRPFARPGTYPVRRGFERHFGTIWGVADYFDPFSLVDGAEVVREVPAGFYLTDAISAKAVGYVREMARDDRPFFLYVAHNAPHWPLHARAEDLARYRDVYRDGWDALRESRYRRQVAIGLIDPATHPLPAPSAKGPAWADLEASRRTHESSLMAAHAAMVDRVDQGVGDLVRALEAAGRLEDTAIFVLSDNGASPERYPNPGFDRPSTTRDGRPIRYDGPAEPGPETTWSYLGPRWAGASNTPYRYWKSESFDGGCHTPLIVHWPAGLARPRGSTSGTVGHVIDLAPTWLDLAGVTYPARFAGRVLAPPEGESLAPILRGAPRPGRKALYFEHEGGRAVLDGDWKIVARANSPWELYHVSDDATETRDLASREPRIVSELAANWRAWASRVGAAIPNRADGPSAPPR